MTATDSMPEYLAEAYRIAHYQPDENYVSTSSLAEEMHVSRAGRNAHGTAPEARWFPRARTVSRHPPDRSR